MKRLQLVLFSIFSAFFLSSPWLNILPSWILFVAFLPLLIVEDHLLKLKSRNKPIVFFAYAFLTFLVWNALTCWWIMHATFVGMIAVIGLNACLMAAVWWLFHTFKRSFNSRISEFALIVIWVAFEYVHYHWDIEWPWLTLGNGFANQVKIIQWFEYTGVLGGTLWVLLVNVLFFKLYQSLERGSRYRLIRSAILVLLFILIPVITSLCIYSSYKEKGKLVDVVILQPNIDPYTEKFDVLSPMEQVNHLIHLADSLVTDSTKYVIAPETAIHPVWENEKLVNHPYLLPFKKIINQFPEIQFVVGATTRKFVEPELSVTARKFEDQDIYFDIYNSVLQIDESDDVQIYHKSKLVSGVEKMPYSKYFSFIEDFIIDLGGTTGSLGRQTEPTVFKGGGGSVAPVICYESIFGGYISKYIHKGAELVFIITNDGWWKDSSGYKQHLSYAQLRAIETRRGIARSANTGISAIINQRGEIVKQTDWWVKTAINGNLYANNELTFYVRYGDFIGRISSFIAVMLILFLISQSGIIGNKKNPH